MEFTFNLLKSYENCSKKFFQYNLDHQNRWNQWLHRFGFLFFSVGGLGCADRIPLSPVLYYGTSLTLAMLFIAMMGVYMIRTHLIVGLVTWISIILMYGVSIKLTMQSNLSLCFLGLVFQIVGHFIFEKNSPALFRKANHFLIGPMFSINEILKRI